MFGWPWFKPKRDPSMAYDSAGNAYKTYKTWLGDPDDAPVVARGVGSRPLTHGDLHRIFAGPPGSIHYLPEGVSGVRFYAGPKRDPYVWVDPWEGR